MAKRQATKGRSRWAIEAALLLVQFAMGLSFLAVAPLFPLIIDDFRVSRAMASLLVGGTSLAVAIVLVPVSVLPGRIGTRSAVTLGGILMSAMALAPLAGSFALLLAARLVFAFGAAVLLTALPAVIVRWFEPRQLAFVNGLGIVAQTLGVATSMSIAAALAGAVGWHATLGGFGAVMALATIVWVVVSAGTAPDPGGAAGISLHDIGAVARDRVTVLLGIGVAGALGANITFSSWLPTYYQEHFGFSLEHAGAAAAVLTIFGMVGSLVGSVVPLRVPRRRPFLLLAGIMLPLAGLGSIVTSSPAVLYGSLTLFGIASAIFIPVTLTIPMEFARIGPARAGIAVAVILSAGNLSGFFVPLAIGAVRDATGSFVFGLAASALLGLALAVVGVLVPETGPVGVSHASAALREPA